MNKRKLLQINAVINSGSTGRIAEGIGVSSLKHGWDSYIAYGRNDNISESKKIKIGNSYDVKFHGFQTRIFDKHGFESKKATKTFIDVIDNLQPDIIHLHNLHGYYLNIEVLFDYLSNINTPIVWTLHDCWAFTGHCTHFSYIGCNKWITQCFNCPQKREYPASFFVDRSRENYEQKKALFTKINNLTIVTVSKWLNNLLNQSFLNKCPVTNIYNGVNTEIFHPSDYSEVSDRYQLNNKFIILGVANIWNERKGFNDFIKLSELIDENDVIVLVGIKNSLMKLLPKNVIGINRTEDILELAKLYSIANVFVNPTWEDNFPTTNIESLSCGTPVITYNTGGSPEALSSETGYIVKQGDLGGIMEALEVIKKNGKLFYTQRCRERAVTDFNQEERYVEYIQLYDNLLIKDL